MAQKLEEMMNEFRYPAAITTDKPLTISGAITSTGGATFTPSGTGLIAVGDSGTGTLAGGSVTINAQRGVITTGSLTTVAGTVAVSTLLDNKISATSQVFASVYNGSNTQGIPAIARITPFSGSATIELVNVATGGSLNGSVVINFLVLS